MDRHPRVIKSHRSDPTNQRNKNMLAVISHIKLQTMSNSKKRIWRRRPGSSRLSFMSNSSMDTKTVSTSVDSIYSSLGRKCSIAKTTVFHDNIKSFCDVIFHFKKIQIINSIHQISARFH